MKRRRTGMTKPALLRAEQRRARVLQLRTAGLTYRAIASVMWSDPAWRDLLPPSYTARHAHEDVMVALRHQRTEMDETVTLVREVELARLDQMMSAVWSRAQSGDDKAIASVLAIMSRRGRLIPQLEAPQPVISITPVRPETPATPVDIHAVAYQLAAYGLAHSNGLVSEPGASP